VNAEINVVSLIDVMMLLLVIFMITAPLMQGGVDVKLPATDARPLESKSPIVITVNQAGTIFVNGDRVTYNEFSATFKTLVGSKASQGVTVQADKRALYDAVAKVLAVIQAAGVTRVSLVTETEAGR
jgi:biopolymer transport protein TolR